MLAPLPILAKRPSCTICGHVHTKDMAIQVEDKRRKAKSWGPKYPNKDTDPNFKHRSRLCAEREQCYIWSLELEAAA